MAALNFPNSPTVGQTYPAPPIEGVPTYTWDGEKWLSSFALGIEAVKRAGDTMQGPLNLKEPPTLATEAISKGYVDTAFVRLAGNQTLTGGFAVTPLNLGNLAGGFTPSPMNGNYQFGSNNGACPIAAPAVDCAIDMLITNVAGAGAITFSGFTVAAGNTGDPLTTTNGHKFIISIRRINAVATYVIKALQ